MSEDNNDMIVHDGMEVDDRGFVIGSGYVRSEDCEYGVDFGVFSYEYERNGETRINHVPSVHVVDERGVILAEPHAHDSESAEKAMDNARGTAKYAFENIEDFIDE